MERNRGSGTAEYTAAMRADHLLHDEAPVLEDAWAVRLIEPPLRASVESGAMHRFLERSGLRPTQGHVVLRARFADDALAAAALRGVQQLVVMAAGLDSSCLRRDARVRVIEVDHPATQLVKRARLADLGAALDGVEFAAIDFEREALADALARTSFDSAEPAFVTWLGVSMYLPAATVLATLAQIRACVAPHSELVFDYSIPVEQLDAEIQQLARAKNEGLARAGEPRITAFDPTALARGLAERGFARVEELGPADLDRRYCASRRDGFSANPEHRVAHVRAV